ncbi:beta-lactamase family protein [candidate division KSB1 bacterium]|nr:beta-lactamase family protein [candidate division KSB1 bacterium]
MRWVFSLIGVIVCIFGHVNIFGISLSSGSYHFSKNAGINLNRPLNVVIDDLEQFIPEFMEEQHIPGLAIGLIRENQLVWSRGFGVKNALTGAPVTPETIFEVASNSKIVTAYIALRLVDENKLSLDTPLNRYLDKPWLPSSPYQNKITLRHVLSHSSGLGHSTTSRENIFPPGEGYSYSAIGISYLQNVIEHISGISLEELAQQYVFAPLNMSSSSFINQADHASRFASGHIHAVIPVLIFLTLFIITLIVLLLLKFILIRVITGKWQLSKKVYRTLSIICFFLPLIGIFILLGQVGLIQFAWLITFCAFLMAFIFILMYYGMRFLIFKMSKNDSVRKWGLILWYPSILCIIIFISSRVINIPVPSFGTKSAGAAGSMHSNINELSRFLIELSHPQYLSEKITAELKTPQVKLADNLSWGLGPGIFHSPNGDALWQWGQHLHFQSIMIIFPDSGAGVIVFTNNDLLNPDTAFQVARRALGFEMESIRRAIHLGFNHQ